MAPATALQGFTGILNTPSAHVQEEGSLNALYSNQTDRFPLGTPDRQDNYLFSAGFFNAAEIGGRLLDTSRDIGVRDLSANAKISTAPLTGSLPYAPAVALGIQDMGGGANFLRTSYLVASIDPFDRLRLSAGYGFGPDRMKGGFGGVELKAHEWVTLLGEYDARAVNAGLRLTSPPLPYIPARFSLTGSVPITRSGELSVAAGISFPLDFKRKSIVEKAVISEKHPAAAVKSSSEPAAAATGFPAPKPDSAGDSLSALRCRLVTAGFVNVRVGVLGGTVLVVEYENIRYNHNELDALGVVAGIAATAAPEGIENVWLVVKRRDIRLLRVSAGLNALRDWLAGTVTNPPTLQVDNDPGSREGVSFEPGDSNTGWFRPSLNISPGLITYVGTEVGVFDYLLSIRPELGLPLWRGGLLSARWDLPVAWSDNFKNGQVFDSSRHDARMDRLMLFQGIGLLPGLTANLGAGMIQYDNNGTLNELVWSPGSGMHSFRFVQAWAHDRETEESRNLLLASYRMYLAAFDLLLEGTGGRFWEQDQGVALELKRFFGDTAVTLYYKNTVTSPEEKRWQAAGIRFSFPLTFRRDMKASPVQIRGADEWSYSQETVLAVNGQKTNDIVSSGLGSVPLPSGSLNRAFFNRDRLNADYIHAHIGRIREAWQLFRGER